MGSIKVWDGSAWQTSSQGPAQNASQTAFTPTGSLSSTDVQAALAEVDSEKAALAGAAFTGTVTGVPGQELQYTQITSNVTLSATTEATANTVITGASMVFDGTPIIIEFYTMQMQTSANGDAVVTLWDGSTDIGRLSQMIALTFIQNQSAYVAKRITPSAGSHSFSIRGWHSVGGNALIGAGNGATGATAPAFMRITKA